LPPNWVWHQTSRPFLMDLFTFRILNFSLGLGENRIKLRLVAVDNSQKLVSVYQIVITRQSRQEQYPAKLIDRLNSTYQICSLIQVTGNRLNEILHTNRSSLQDCALPIYPTLPCGLHPTGTSCTRHQISADRW